MTKKGKRVNAFELIKPIRVIFLASSILIFLFSISFATFSYKFAPQIKPAEGEVYDPFVEEGCVTAGCNGEICQGEDEEEVISLCVYKEEYACYRTARCEVWEDGKCGWTPTDELTGCLNKFAED